MTFTAIIKDGRVTGVGRIVKHGEDKLVDTSPDELADAFRDADEETLPGTDVAIEEAIENPTRYYDYLKYENDSFTFDDGYERSND